MTLGCLAHDCLESKTLTYVFPRLSPDYLPALTPSQKHDCRPTNFITTALNCTVLEPSNYSSLRCGRVEKGCKSTEAGVPGLELWENWKQMTCPFPYPFLLSPFFSPTPYLTVGLRLWLPGTMKDETVERKWDGVRSMGSGGSRDCSYIHNTMFSFENTSTLLHIRLASTLLWSFRDTKTQKFGNAAAF